MTSANPENFGAHMGNAADNAQEEEWEREGLLDPAWEKQQRKVRLNKSTSVVRTSDFTFKHVSS